MKKAIWLFLPFLFWSCAGETYKTALDEFRLNLSGNAYQGPQPNSAPLLVASSDSGLIGDDLTKIPTPQVSGSGAPAGWAAVLYVNGSELGDVTIDSSGDWLFSITNPLAEGSYSIRYRYRDEKGNLSELSPALSLTIDTTAPTITAALLQNNNSYVTINLSEGGYRSDLTALTLADSSVTFNQNSGGATGATATALLKTDGSAVTGGENALRVNLSITGTPSGVETVVINLTGVTDAAGNSANLATSSLTLNPKFAYIIAANLNSNNDYITVTFDEPVYTDNPPTAGLVAADFVATVTPNGGNVTGATITNVTKQDGSPIAGGETVVRVYVTLTGGSPAGLAAGVETIRLNAVANQIFTVGGLATASSENTGELLLNDKLPPNPPTGLDLAAASDSGLSDSDNITNVTTGLTISGMAEPNATVKLYTPNSSGTLLATTTATAGGTFAVGIDLTGGDGSYPIVATATDAANNTSSDSASLTIVIDTANPAPANAPQLAASHDTGSSSSDGITNLTTLLFTAPAGTAEGLATVRFYISSTLVGSTTAAANGSYSVSLDLAAYANTSFTLVTRQLDIAGNPESVNSAGANITIDTTAPAAPSTPDLAAADDSGLSDSDNITNVTTGLTLSGTAENGALIEIFTPNPSGTLLGSATATGGNYTVDVSLSSDGVFPIIARATDLAGNVGAASAALNITIDTTAPVISGVTPAANSYVTHTQISYTLSENCATGSTTWTRLTGAADPSSPHIQAWVGSELHAGTKSNITLTNNPTLVSHTTYRLDFNCSDAAGNVASTISSNNVTYDVTAPVITVSSPTNNANVNSTAVSYSLSEVCQSASITWTRVAGPADAASPHVKALMGSELNAGSHNNIIITNNPSLVDGTSYDMVFACSDLAGNAATPVSVTNVTYSAGPPQVVSAETLDTNNNGKIDTYRISFNKAVKDDTFPGYVANALGSVTSHWLVAGYANVRLIHGSAVTFATDTANDSVIYIRFDETPLGCDVNTQVGCDTGAKPDLTTSATPGLEDHFSNVLAQLTTTSVTEADGANPILVAAKAISPTTVQAIFSEIMDSTTAENFPYYTITGSGGLTVSAAAIDGGNQKIVNLTTSSQTGGAAYTLTVNTLVKDLANRNLTSPYNTANFTGLENPVVVSIVTNNATQLTITFSEVVTASSTECANLTACAAIYQNTSLPVTSAVSTAGAGINSATFYLYVNTMVEGQLYTTTVVPNTVTSAATSLKITASGNSYTFTGDGPPAAIIHPDTATDCPLNGPNRRVVVQYDQAVTATALTTTNYKITGCITNDCTVTNGHQAPNTAGAATVSSLGANKYAVDFTNAFETDGSLYQLTITGVQDTTGNTILAPGNFSFQCGNDTTPPSLISVSVVSATPSATVLVLNFTEAVDNVTGNLTTNYQYDTSGWGTQVNSAARQTNYAQVQVIFQPAIPNGGHQLFVRNVQDLAGNAILNNGINNMQPFIVNAPVGLSGGPVFENPFNDGATGGLVVQYDGKLYIGPDINASKLFETNLEMTAAQTITLDADGTVGLPYEDFNGFVTRFSGCDTAFGNPPGPTEKCAIQYPIWGVDTIYGACIGAGNPTLTGSACTSAGGVERLFIGGLNTQGFYKSFWITGDKSSLTTTFTFTEAYSGDTGGGFAYRSSNMLVFRDYLWVNFGAEQGGGGRGGRICVNPSGCATGQSYLQYTGFPNMSRITRIGATNISAPYLRNGSYPGVAGYIGSTAPDNSDVLNAITTMYEHDNDGPGGNVSQLYLANGGYYTGSLPTSAPWNRSGTSDGGIVRTQLAYSTNTSLPNNCSSNADGCVSGTNPFYEDITPDGLEKWSRYLSIPLPQNSKVTGWTDANSNGVNDSCENATTLIEMDCVEPYNQFTPSTKAIPYMRTAPNGDLYMLRNACDTKQLNLNGVNGANGVDFRVEKQVCPLGHEIPQLWMMPKNCGSAAACAAAWQLVAEFGTTGKTNMAGNTSACGTSPNKCLSNSHITLLEVLGDYLYIGFDNLTYGSNIWRVNMSSVTSGNTPAQSAFQLVSNFGLDSSANNRKIFSHLKVHQGGKDWLIILSRDGINPIRLYRTNNDQN